MARGRVPQNSASSSHQRVFTDLQIVYQKIIQTSGTSFPFRSKDSRRLLHTAPAHASRSQQQQQQQQPFTSSQNSAFYTRAPSVCSSVQEIIIKPLQFHDRDNLSSCGSRCNSNPGAEVAAGAKWDIKPLNSSCDAEYSNNFTECFSGTDSKLSRIRSRSSMAHSVEYSEQSIRYVAEQVSLEQARQLKLRSNVKQHRVDRRYFVSGSKLPIQKQAFEDMHDTLVQSNDSKQLNMMNLGGSPCSRQNQTAHTCNNKRILAANRKRTMQLGRGSKCAVCVPDRRLGVVSDTDMIIPTAVAIPTVPIVTSTDIRKDENHAIVRPPTNGKRTPILET